MSQKSVRKTPPRPAAKKAPARPVTNAALKLKLDVLENELGQVKEALAKTQDDLTKTQAALLKLLVGLRAQAVKQAASALTPKIQQAVEARLLAQGAGAEGQDMDALLASIGINGAAV